MYFNVYDDTNAMRSFLLLCQNKDQVFDYNQHKPMEAEPEILIERGDVNLCAKWATLMALKSAKQLFHIVMQIMLKDIRKFVM